MLNLCAKCNKPLEENEMVMFVCTGRYHKLNSIRTWAVDPNSLEADVRSVKHVICNQTEGD